MGKVRISLKSSEESLTNVTWERYSCRRGGTVPRKGRVSLSAIQREERRKGLYRLRVNRSFHKWNGPLVF